MELLVVNRQCGTCTVCCDVVGVEELEKEYYRPCEYQTDSGCSIYSRRPESCAKYKCMYLQGVIKNRPDECGFLFHLVVEEGPQYNIEIYEVYPSPDYDKFQYILERILNRTTEIPWNQIKLHKFGSKIGTSFPSPYYMAGNLGRVNRKSRLIFVKSHDMTVEEVDEWMDAVLKVVHI